MICGFPAAAAATQACLDPMWGWLPVSAATPLYIDEALIFCQWLAIIRYGKKNVLLVN